MNIYMNLYIIRSRKVNGMPGVENQLVKPGLECYNVTGKAGTATMFRFLLVIIYISFTSLGLPDALLGAVWPTMQPLFGVPVSYMGIVSFMISAGTITSSLLSDRLTKRFGAGLGCRILICGYFAGDSVCGAVFNSFSDFYNRCL